MIKKKFNDRNIKKEESLKIKKNINTSENRSKKKNLQMVHVKDAKEEYMDLNKREEKISITKKIIPDNKEKKDNITIFNIYELCEEFEIECINIFKKANKRLLKFLFEKYRNTMNSKKCSTFQSLQEKRDFITAPEIYKMLKDNNIQKAMIRNNELFSILKQIAKNPFAFFDTAYLNYSEFVDSFIQIAIFLYEKDPVMKNLNIVEKSEKLLNYIIQNDKNNFLSTLQQVVFNTK